MPKSLLVADDSLTIRKVIDMIFATEDFEITSVDNGLEAISKARELCPDLVLADVAMPGRSGYEVCDALKSDPQTQSIPVMLLAGTFEPFDESRARAARADDYIIKPFESQALLDKVRTLTGAPKSAEPARRVFATESSASGARPPPSRVPAPPGASAPSAAAFLGNGPPRPSAPTYSLGQAVPRPNAPGASAPARPLPPTPLGQASIGRPPAPRAPTPPHMPLPPQRPMGPVPRPTSAVASAHGPNLAAAYPPRPQTIPAQSLRGQSAIGAAANAARPGQTPMPVAAPASRVQAPFPPMGGYESLRGGEAPSVRPIQMARDGGEALLRDALSKASREVIEKVVWEVVPQLAETIIREHLDQLVKSREGQN